MDNKPSIIFRGLNVRGLKSYVKRQNMFDWLKGINRDEKNAVIAHVNILSETHCNLPQVAARWGKQWSVDPKNSLFSLGTSRRKGVAILFNDKLREIFPDMKVSHINIDTRGRFIKCILTINDCKFRILGVYAPNNPLLRIQFFLDLAEVINDGVDDAENICGGDWNCTKDSRLDRYNCVSQNDSGRSNLEYLCHLFDLEDIFRRRFPAELEYTWSGRGRCSRIDYWLTSRSLDNQVDNVFHCFAPYTDHSAINLVLNTEEVTRGKGTWKMNTEHLLHEDFRNRFSEMWEDWQDKKDQYDDIKKWWDLGKRHIKTFAQNYSYEFSANNRSKLQELEEKIDLLKKANADYKNLQKEYEDIFSNKSKGARVRSRAQWWEEGEKSSKYFFNLEKRNSKEKSWSKILDKNNHTVTGTKNIQKRQVEFYKELYKSQSLSNNEPEMDFFLKNSHQKKLSDESKAFLDSDISLEETAKSLKKMKNNKSPGPDGIVTEFYKLYWGLIGSDLYEVICSGLEDKQLAYSQYLATIILLYKKGPRPDIRNWRPIALLNNDYKLISKVYAERMKTVLPEIISQDQKGCVAGRYIGENIRMIDDILYEIENQSPDSKILQLDQEKAFDRVEWNWLFSVLSHFNFGDIFIQNLKTLYKNAKVSIMTNGFQSEYFEITRGIRQGDSLSALLYIVQFEPLMAKIRESKEVEGVTLNLKNINETVTIKGCQYVDDSNNTLKSMGSVKSFFKILEKFEKVSGSKVNFSKTVCLAVDEKLVDPQGILEPTIGPEKVLGIPLGKNRNDTEDFWNKRIKKLEAKLNMWRLRNLSFEGKTLIIRSLGISQITNAIEALCVSEEHIKRVNDILFNFLWSGKKCKIKKEICFLPKEEGGLNMVDIKTLIKVKRVQWIIRCLKDHSGQPWSKLIENYLRCLDNTFDIRFFTLKVTDSSDIIKNAKIPLFYKECINFFQELRRIGGMRHDNEIVWCNDRYKFLGKTVSMGHWSKSGFKLIGDLYKDGVLCENSIKEKLSIKSGFFFEMWRLKKTLPRTCNVVHENEELIAGDRNFILDMHISVPNVGIKPIRELTSKDIYSVFINNSKPISSSFLYWSNKFGEDEINWKRWYLVNTINKYLPRPVKDFNWKIIYNLVYTNMKLRLMKASDGFCDICKVNEENLEHVLFSCNHSRRTWLFVQEVLRATFDENIMVDKTVALSGFREDEVSDEVLFKNMITGITRFHIWKIRNSIKKDGETFTYLKRIHILKAQISQHLDLLMGSKSIPQCKIQILQLLKDNLNNTRVFYYIP